MLRRLVVYYTSLGDRKQRTNIYEFSDYKNVEGLMMPSKLRLIGNRAGWEYLDSEFDVKYDENTFVKPPPFGAGPELEEGRIQKRSDYLRYKERLKVSLFRITDLWFSTAPDDEFFVNLYRQPPASGDPRRQR